MSATRGRQRKLDSVAQVKLCQLVAAGATVAAAADRVGVTLRTVQREVNANEDFEHDLRLAEEAAPVDPLKLMQAAAKAHWRAAAWLLERTDPETYGKRPPRACTAAQFQQALDSILQAALEQAPPSARRDLAQSFQAAAQRAQAALFIGRDQRGRAQSNSFNHKLQPAVDSQPQQAQLDPAANDAAGILSPEMQLPSEPPAAKPTNTSPVADAPRHNSSPQDGATEELTAPELNFVAKNERCDKTASDSQSSRSANEVATGAEADDRLRQNFRRHRRDHHRNGRAPQNSVAKNALDQQLDALEARALFVPRGVG